MKLVRLIATALILAAAPAWTFYLVFDRPALPVASVLNPAPSVGPPATSDPWPLLTGRGELKLVEGGEVEYRYNETQDSGVHLVRRDSDGKELWRALCDPLGVIHSLYLHQVEVRREGGRLVVTSRGSYGSFIELLELASGKRIERSEMRHHPEER